ncbi:Holliday junction branch migration protein RuvA [Bacillus chungangensis]|uniref:Holliday junction branch migration complex subunit RuvA n=1 Tax=Bacillus chungangensis TaxID=587633 RepID=A0ABT9WM11_9BACI|nr:Holliday junction branch migration protein RuvA [Bacillus chungangensis]MDQ0174296.1 Holliday junction DNA helicase RuvA [Bacillus chungangensis]
MYEYIKGTITFVCPEYIVVENNQIGYQILTPNPFVFSSKEGETLQVYTYQHVREDVLALYGFQSLEEKNMFKKLLHVSGIGPKGALAILASGEPGQVIQAIETEDETFLMKFPGVGKKTARQMILDLKGKLQDIIPAYGENLEKTKQESLLMDDNHKELEEAVLALKALGYSEREINKIMPSLQKETATTDQYIKRALQKLLT